VVSAGNMVQQSDKGTRHIVLFADAADAEELAITFAFSKECGSWESR
jgi:hypothetical protein